MLHTTINANVGFSSHIFSKVGSHFIFCLIVYIASMIASSNIQFGAFPDEEFASKIKIRILYYLEKD